MVPASVSVPRGSFLGSCSSGRCFKNSKWISFTYGLSAFQTAASVLDPRVSESVCELLKSEVSIPYSHMVPGPKLHWFSKPDIFGLSSPWCRFQDLGPSCGDNPLALQGDCEMPQLWAAVLEMGVFGETVSPILMCPFYFLLWRSLFRYFSGRLQREFFCM